MQTAGLRDILQVSLNCVDAVLKHAAIKFDLGFAGAAEKSAAAALAFQMRPGADKPPLLIREMRQLHLQHAFPRPGAGAKNFENEPGSIDDLGIPRLLEIALLHRRHDVVDDDETDVEFAYPLADFIDLPRSEQGRWARLRQRHDRRVDDVEVDGLCKSDGFGETIFRRVDLRKRLRLFADAHLAFPYGNKHEGPRSGRASFFPTTPALAWRIAPRVLAVIRTRAQLGVPSPSCSLRLTGPPGMIVEMACL